MPELNSYLREKRKDGTLNFFTNYIEVEGEQHEVTRIIAADDTKQHDIIYEEEGDNMNIITAGMFFGGEEVVFHRRGSESLDLSPSDKKSYEEVEEEITNQIRKYFPEP